MQHHRKQKQAQNRAKSARWVGVKDRSGPRFSNTDTSRSKGISGRWETLMGYLKFSKYIPGTKTTLADAQERVNLTQMEA